MFQRLRYLDFWMLLAIIITALFGIVMIYSATQVSGVGTHQFEHYSRLQMLWFLVALGALVITMSLPYRMYDALAFVFYGMIIFVLLLLLFGGLGSGRAGRWISLGPMHIQPSEFSKLTLIFILARYYSGKNKDVTNLFKLIIPGLLTIVPFALVLKQPDLGTALVLGAIFIIMSLWAGLSFRYLLLLMSPGITMFLVLLPEISPFEITGAIFLLPLLSIAIILAVLYFTRTDVIESLFILGLNIASALAANPIWNELKPYQQKRIITFMNPTEDPLGTGYQITQSKIAIGSGGFLGKGIFEGTQKRLEFLPEQHTDFIFSVLGEELGYVGCFILIFLYGFILIRGLNIAVQSKDKFASFICVGIIGMLLFHIFVNIGMTIGLMPVTGVPLPLMSYGGSSLVLTFTSLGIILGVGMRKYDY